MGSELDRDVRLTLFLPKSPRRTRLQRRVNTLERMDSTTVVRIYLPVRGAQVSLLSIPYGDIQRLSIRPLKWMRFVMFSICGARGDLAASPDGPPVNYDHTSLDKDQYHYKPLEEFIFVDPHGLNDKITSSVLTERRTPFGMGVIERDGEFCVFTGEDYESCEAAHLIPRSKGSEYIETVVRDRSERYDPAQRPSIKEINDVQNGIFVSAVVHRKFGHGIIGFLKTPNFAMDSTDIPRIVQGSADGNHITLHQLRPPRRFNPAEAQDVLGQAMSGRLQNPVVAFSAGLNVDALFPNPQLANPSPPAIILDFMYGVAAYNLWKSESIHDVVKDYFERHYKSIPIPTRCEPHEFDDGEGGPTNSSDDGYHSPRRSKRDYSKRENVLASAMDEMNLVMMYLRGVTPQEVARRREKRIEEEEMIARETSRSKVTEWMKTADVVESPRIAKEKQILG